MTTTSAQCTLLSFLGAPEAQPPEDWASAAARSNTQASVDSESLVERARVAGEQADLSRRNIARLEGARTPMPTVDRATAVLAASFNVTNARAYECLLWVSEQAGTELPDVAEQFMERVDATNSRSNQRQVLLDLLAKLAAHPDAVAD